VLNSVMCVSLVPWKLEAIVKILYVQIVPEGIFLTSISVSLMTLGLAVRLGAFSTVTASFLATVSWCSSGRLSSPGKGISVCYNKKKVISARPFHTIKHVHDYFFGGGNCGLSAYVHLPGSPMEGILLALFLPFLPCEP
jgi:hypothetical protein